jgi:hypothetical protein
MTSYAHFAVFWLAGLLTGTLLGWMLGRVPAAEARARSDERAPAPGDHGRS